MCCFYLQNTFINLRDVVCIQSVKDAVRSAVFTLHLMDQMSMTPKAAPLKVSADTEQELEDWVR